jgi:hypothetical protein
MDLPIDVRKAPFKPKYLTDETFATRAWMVFGEYDDGTVGISDGDTDIFSHVPHQAATDIVVARNEFVRIVLKHVGMK